MHLASKTIPDASNSDDPRLKVSIIQWIGGCNWIGLYWNLYDKMHSLRGIVELSFMEGDISPDVRILARQNLHQLCCEMLDIRSLNLIEGILNQVRTSLNIID